jgi:hypothetical protein
MKPVPWWLWPLLVVLVPPAAIILVIAVVVGAAAWLVIAGVLLPTVWLAWCTRGRYALVVYSNSPIWQEYFEHAVLPAVGDRAVVLNWSDRKRWRYSLAAAAFRFFGGRREFNPLAMVFRPFAWPRTFRFYGPFKAFKHGRPEEVEEMRRAFLEMLNDLGPVEERR